MTARMIGIQNDSFLQRLLCIIDIVQVLISDRQVEMKQMIVWVS